MIYIYIHMCFYFFFQILFPSFVCAQLSLTLCEPIDYSPPGSSIHGIFQARILERVAISYSRRIFLTKGSDPCPLHLLYWQVDSLPLHRLGSPCCKSSFIKLLIRESFGGYKTLNCGGPKKIYFGVGGEATLGHYVSLQC